MTEHVSGAVGTHHNFLSSQPSLGKDTVNTPIFQRRELRFSKGKATCLGSCGKMETELGSSLCGAGHQ